MQFSTLLSVFSFTTAAAIPSGSFGLITIHSGSDAQYQPIKLSSDGHLSLNGETDVTFKIDSDGLLYANDHHIDLDSGAFVASDERWNQGQWTIEDSHLKYLDADAFVICPNQNFNLNYAKYGVPNNCENPIGVSLRTVDI